MQTLCEQSTQEAIASLVGKKLRSIRAFRYPNSAFYSRVSLVVSDGEELQLTLTSVSIAQKFEVFVVKLIEGAGEVCQFPFDEIVLHDFDISSADIIRTLEWLGDTIESADCKTEVDSGLRICDLVDRQFVFEADAFPELIRLSLTPKPEARQRQHPDL
jgi:hypothetical protein